jgi:hypothetical protein
MHPYLTAFYTQPDHERIPRTAPYLLSLKLSQAPLFISIPLQLQKTETKDKSVLA